jgi:hypothetical protein
MRVLSCGGLLLSREGRECHLGTEGKGLVGNMLHIVQEWSLQIRS